MQVLTDVATLVTKPLMPIRASPGTPPLSSVPYEGAPEEYQLLKPLLEGSGARLVGDVQPEQPGTESLDSTPHGECGKTGDEAPPVRCLGNHPALQPDRHEEQRARLKAFLKPTDCVSISQDGDASGCPCGASTHKAYALYGWKRRQLMLMMLKKHHAQKRAVDSSAETMLALHDARLPAVDIGVWSQPGFPLHSPILLQCRVSGGTKRTCALLDEGCEGSVLLQPLSAEILEPAVNKRPRGSLNKICLKIGERLILVQEDDVFLEAIRYEWQQELGQRADLTKVTHWFTIQGVPIRLVHTAVNLGLHRDRVNPVLIHFALDGGARKGGKGKGAGRGKGKGGDKGRGRGRTAPQSTASSAAVAILDAAYQGLETVEVSSVSARTEDTPVVTASFKDERDEFILVEARAHGVLYGANSMHGWADVYFGDNEGGVPVATVAATGERYVLRTPGASIFGYKMRRPGVYQRIEVENAEEYEALFAGKEIRMISPVRMVNMEPIGDLPAMSFVILLDVVEGLLRRFPVADLTESNINALRDAAALFCMGAPAMLLYSSVDYVVAYKYRARAHTAGSRVVNAALKRVGGPTHVHSMTVLRMDSSVALASAVPSAIVQHGYSLIDVYIQCPLPLKGIFATNRFKVFKTVGVNEDSESLVWKGKLPMCDVAFDTPDGEIRAYTARGSSIHGFARPVVYAATGVNIWGAAIKRLFMCRDDEHALCANQDAIGYLLPRHVLEECIGLVMGGTNSLMTNYAVAEHIVIRKMLGSEYPRHSGVVPMLWGQVTRVQSYLGETWDYYRSSVFPSGYRARVMPIEDEPLMQTHHEPQIDVLPGRITGVSSNADITLAEWDRQRKLQTSDLHVRAKAVQTFLIVVQTLSWSALWFVAYPSIGCASLWVYLLSGLHERRWEYALGVAKRVLYLSYHKEYADNLYHCVVHPDIKVDIQLKKDEFAKWGKFARVVASLGNNVLFCGFLLQWIKGIFLGVTYDVTQVFDAPGWGFHIHCAKSAPLNMFDEVPQRNVAYVFSDDMTMYAFGSRIDIDISSCDSSNGYMIFTLLAYLFKACWVPSFLTRGFFAPCRSQATMRNPNNTRECIVFKPTTVIEWSGWVGTTIINFVSSIMIAGAIFHALARRVKSTDEPLTSDEVEVICKKAAFAIGFTITAVVRENPAKQQFLKMSPLLAVGKRESIFYGLFGYRYVDCREGERVLTTNLGPFFRGFGGTVGDIQPEHCGVTTAEFRKLCASERWELRMSAIVQGMCNEPTCPVMGALRRRYPPRGVAKNERFFRCEVDRSHYVIGYDGLMERYGGDLSDWQTLVHSIEHLNHGEMICSRAVSKILAADYGYEEAPPP